MQKAATTVPFILLTVMLVVWTAIGALTSFALLVEKWWNISVLISSYGCIVLASCAISLSVFKIRASFAKASTKFYLCLVLVAPVTYLVSTVPSIPSPPIWLGPGLASAIIVGAGLYFMTTRIEQ